MLSVSNTYLSEIKDPLSISRSRSPYVITIVTRSAFELGQFPSERSGNEMKGCSVVARRETPSRSRVRDSQSSEHLVPVLVLVVGRLPVLLSLKPASPSQSCHEHHDVRRQPPERHAGRKRRRKEEEPLHETFIRCVRREFSDAYPEPIGSEASASSTCDSCTASSFL